MAGIHPFDQLDAAWLEQTIDTPYLADSASLKNE